MSVEEYLRQESTAEERHVGHEYVAGEVYAMSPISARHAVITQNILRHLHEPTRAGGCGLFGDVLTKIAEDRFYYPDVVITCAPLGPRDVIEQPCFVAEVTSPSTRTTDLREKPLAYRGNAGIKGFLIAEQRRRHVIQYTRRSNGDWDRLELTGSGTLAIPCIDAELTLDQIYDTLEFPLAVREGDEFTVAEYEGEWVLVRAEAMS
jgi:Uma2 family endonuclease